jgi:hypothetical protein
MYMIDHYIPVFARLTELLDQAEASDGVEYDDFRVEMVHQVEKASADARDAAGDDLAHEATFAVDAIDVDWNEQAAKSAEDYLGFSSFSRSGLIEQLEFEGYAREQAEYGVTQAGL